MDVNLDLQNSYNTGLHMQLGAQQTTKRERASPTSGCLDHPGPSRGTTSVLTALRLDMKCQVTCGTAGGIESNAG